MAFPRGVGLKAYYWNRVWALTDGNGEEGSVIVLAMNGKQATELAVAKYVRTLESRGFSQSERHRQAASLLEELMAKPPEEIAFPHALLFEGHHH